MTAIDDNPEFWHGLTMWGEFGSVQVRDGAIALYVKPDAERSSEDGHPAIISSEDARRFRDLLNVATARGALAAPEQGEAT